MEKLTQYMLMVDIAILVMLSIDVYISYQNMLMLQKGN